MGGFSESTPPSAMVASSCGYDGHIGWAEVSNWREWKSHQITLEGVDGYTTTTHNDAPSCYTSTSVGRYDQDRKPCQATSLHLVNCIISNFFTLNIHAFFATDSLQTTYLTSRIHFLWIRYLNSITPCPQLPLRSYPSRCPSNRITTSVCPLDAHLSAHKAIMEDLMGVGEP